MFILIPCRDRFAVRPSCRRPVLSSFPTDALPISRQYVAFGDVPPGGVRYIVENLLPGTFELEAYLDLDGSTNPATETFIIETEDPYDRYAPLLLEPNRTTNGVDLHLEQPISR